MDAAESRLLVEELPPDTNRLEKYSGYRHTMVGRFKRKARAATSASAQPTLRSYLAPSDLYWSPEHPSAMTHAATPTRGTLGLVPGQPGGRQHGA